MDYIKRELERKFLEADRFFKAVLVIGARQVGKSTMLRHLAEKQDRTVVTMDDDFVRELALNDPRLFFQTYKPPILIDEIQKAPNLLEHIKIMCDERGAGAFLADRFPAQEDHGAFAGIFGRTSWHIAVIWSFPAGENGRT